jgi:hypothetical protein
MEMGKYMRMRNRMREDRKKNADTAKKAATEKSNTKGVAATATGPHGGKFKIIKGGKKVYLPKGA